MHLVTPDAMREMDRRTIDEVGIPSSVLMDRAARGAVDALLQHFQPPRGADIGIVCGTGNNGGDGLAMATMLDHQGYKPQVLVLGKPDSLSDDARLYFDIASHSLHNLATAEDEESVDIWFHDQGPCALWCDALLGTGLDRPVRGRYATAIDALKRRPSPIVAVDIPSGIDGHTGQILGTAARAEMTTTFGFAKCGQCIDPARRYCGILEVIDIGIPADIRDAVGVAALGLNEHWCTTHLPTRARDIHKGISGRTLHIGGRPETAGAIALSARGALVGGAGLISVGTDRDSQAMIPTATPEVMARALFETGTQSVDVDALVSAVETADTVVVGPGLGTDGLAQRVLLEVVNAAPERLVVDADGLNLMASDDEIADAVAAHAKRAILVLTPHPGEMARLQDCSVKTVLTDPLASAAKLAHRWQATAVLKTAATVVVDPAGAQAINRTGHPGMATGGMGDALTGLIAAAFADFPADPFLASTCAVAVHGLAGERAALSTGTRGLTVRRLLDEVPAVWQSLQG